MRAPTTIAVALLSAQLAGCSWAQKLWPWSPDEKDVPVTAPTEATPPPAAPAPTAAAPEALPAPAPLAKAGPPPNLAELLYGPQYRPPAEPATSRPAVRQPAVTIVQPPAPTSRPAGGGTGPRVLPVGPSPPTRPPTPPGPTSRPVGVEQVVAPSALQVHGRLVTVEEVLHAVRPEIDKLPKGVSEPTFRLQVSQWIAIQVRDKVTRALVLNEADKRLNEEQKKIVGQEAREAYDEMLAQAGGSKTALRQKLAREGTTLEDTLRRHREDATFKLYLRARFMPAIVITRKMLWDSYRRNREKYTIDKKVQMRLIAAPLRAFYAEGVTRPSALEKAAARKKARETIDQAAAAVKAGEDFAQVAKRLSRGIKAADGGLWPLMAVDSFRETQVEQAAFRLPAGGVSGVIETDSGFYLVKAKHVQPGRVVPFEDAQEDIEKTLRDRLYMELTDKYFRDLMAKAHVLRTEPFIRQAVDQAVEQRFGP